MVSCVIEKHTYTKNNKTRERLVLFLFIFISVFFTVDNVTHALCHYQENVNEKNIYIYTRINLPKDYLFYSGSMNDENIWRSFDKLKSQDLTHHSFRYKYYLTMPVFRSGKKKSDEYYCKIYTMDAELQFTIEVS